MLAPIKVWMILIIKQEIRRTILKSWVLQANLIRIGQTQRATWELLAQWRVVYVRVPNLLSLCELKDCV